MKLFLFLLSKENEAKPAKMNQSIKRKTRNIVNLINTKIFVYVLMFNNNIMKYQKPTKKPYEVFMIMKKYDMYLICRRKRQ